MAYQSGEFSVPGAPPEYPPALAYFNQQLWMIGGNPLFSVAGSAQEGNMSQTTLTLEQSGQGGTTTIDLQAGAAKSSANWTTSTLSIPGLSNEPATFSRCAAVPLGDALFLFWSQAYLKYQGVNGFEVACGLVASRYAANDDGEMAWGDALTLSGTGGDLPLMPAGLTVQSNPDVGPQPVFPYADVAATPFGTDTIIVASACRQTVLSDAPSVYIGAFNVNDIDLQNNTWKAQSQVWIPVSQLQGTTEGKELFAQGIGAQLSIDWFTSSAGPNGSPPYWLWVSVYPLNALTGHATVLVPLDTAGNPSPATPDNSYPVYIETESPFLGVSTPGFAVRDPAGRVRTYALTATLGEQTLQLGITSYDTYQAIQTDSTTSPLSSVREVLATSTTADSAPSAAFFTDMNGGQSITVNGQDGTQYPVYEFIVYVGSDELLCQVNLLGYAHVLPNYASFLPVPSVTDTFIISGIVDGPIPVPNANIASVSFQDTQPNFGTVSYSATATQSTSHTVSHSWTVGFQSEGESDKGFGPAWNVAINGGAGYTNGTVSTTSIASTQSQESLLDLGTSSPNQAIIPAGTVFCSQAVIQATAYRFVDPDGNPISDATNADAANQAPLMVTIQTTFTDAGSQQYLPYAVTPGDLASYRPDMLDARMQALGYDGDSYFEQVVMPNAYTFQNGQNYLEVSWSADSETETAFQATDSAFTEQGWTFDASVYLGVSGGEGATIFGFGEEENFKFLVGGTFSSTANSTSGTTTGWGISIQSPFGPPSVDDPSAMSSYTFRVYFLPPPAPPSALPPNYWVQELAQQLAAAAPPPTNLPFDPLNSAEIDPNACAWKIMYVVTAYQSNDGSQSYAYPGN